MQYKLVTYSSLVTARYPSSAKLLKLPDHLDFFHQFDSKSFEDSLF